MKIGSENWDRLIADGANELGIPVTLKVLKQFSVYANELLVWNRKINLTAITDAFEIAVKHFIDSMAPVPLIRPDDVIVDIGSGGGFPGIPLAILFPGLRITLIDTSRKKVNFLKHIGRLLNLDHMSALQVRAEDLIKNSSPGVLPNTVVISRALFPLKKLIAVTLPMVSGNGRLIAMKGKTQNIDKEIHDAKGVLTKWEEGHPKRGYEVTLHPYRLKPIGAERSIIQFQFQSEMKAG